MRKRAKVKSKIDYRRRWPTQQTLVESRPARRTFGLKRRWEKLHVGLKRRLKKRSSREPGKSTHPYDTGLGEQGNDSGSTSTPTSASTEDGQRCWRLPGRIPRSPSPPAPVPKIALIKAESRPETPKTPVQLLRILTGPRRSPLPSSRNTTPFDSDKPAVRCTHSRAQVQDLQPKTSQPVVKTPKALPNKFKWCMRIFKLRSSD
ncbi:hypothetical protein F4678DRAFT_202543 [Xylaria arbuscula]|nr:hypothetical protein F4678DRAFT_202543 [Xylaria arbuscula]